jgi:hypothetical protein
MFDKGTIPNWLKNVFTFVVVIISLTIIPRLFGLAFRASPWIFLILWILIPCLTWLIKNKNIYSIFTVTGLKFFRICSIVAIVSISFLFFTHYDYLRDIIGSKFIDGYSVDYCPDYDDFGRRWLNADVSVDKFYMKVVLWLSQWIFLAFCLGLPFLTWKGITKAIENKKKEERFRVAS